MAAPSLSKCSTAHSRSDDTGVNIHKLKQRFRLDHVVLVGDRGLITQARISEEIKSAGLDWIAALRAPAIKALLQNGALQLSLLDQRRHGLDHGPRRPGNAQASGTAQVMTLWKEARAG